MLKNPIHELALFFDMEWVPDAAGARRLFDLPHDTPELEAMQPEPEMEIPRPQPEMTMGEDARGETDVPF